jgi:hypothetical protein
MASHISRISRDSAKLISILDKNIDNIVKKINNRQTTLIKEIENREHEVNMINSLTGRNSITNKNNRLRIEYIEMEICVLKKLLNRGE